MTNEYYMLQAMKEAKKAYDDGEVPVGAIITINNRSLQKAITR